MKQQQKIGAWLGLMALFGPTAATAHEGMEGGSAFLDMAHRLLHAVEEPATIAAFSVGLTLALLIHYRKRGGRS